MIETIQEPQIKRSDASRSLWHSWRSKLKPFIIFNDSLDQTRGGTPRYRDEGNDPGTFRASGHGINFPTVLFIYLLGQLIGGIWWAATLQARIGYLEVQNAKLEAAIENFDIREIKSIGIRNDKRIDGIEDWIKLTREQLARKGL